MIFLANEVDRNPASAAVDASFVRQSGGSGSNPSMVLPDIDPAAVMVSESGDAGRDSPSVNVGIEQSVPVQVENGVLNAGAATPEFWMHGFEIGDMVWGKVKSHPWWPGYIYNVPFAPPDVRTTRKEGHLLVAFFGDSSYGWFLPDELIPFQPYYLEKSKQTTSKNFLLAMDEAVYEESRRAALGLTCRCRNARNFRYFGFPGYVRVDVPGYERGAEYSVKQIEASQESFVPEELLSSLMQLALASRSEEPWSIDFIRRKARLLAYRKAVYEEYDETYPQAFGVQPLSLSVLQ
ncbi:putative DNA mismatch repair protein Msh6-like [Cocos nucifera]|uniref:Putative DNA mismatch repair protein Msh6-like n=1 Tax=Cocos nucifera TaxID=13894 RepID=A0A8K0IQL9_COCNU|nr:putative DNA mismatch repair protein Msh6-like [Cocos nucifera]